MPRIKTNERELSGQIVNWFNDMLHNRSGLQFYEVTGEPGIMTGGQKTRFGDVVLWRNRQAKDAYSYIELKPPFGASENLTTFKEKARELRVRFACTWDFQTLNAYEVREHDIVHIGSDNMPVLQHIDEFLRGDKKALIRSYLARIVDELSQLHAVGKFHKFQPDKVYFIRFVRDIKERLTPRFEAFIRQNSRDRHKREKINAYCAKQGMVNPSEEFATLAEQAVYGLITKVIFYLTIQRYASGLPDLLDNEEDLGKTISKAFARAREIDWQAVFEDDPIEELGIPEDSFDDLRRFFGELKAYHFGELPEDVIGQLFEEIIDPEHRHRLGQYFTREDLVDLVIGAVVRDKDGIYADPTCGSGTFLVRLYDRLKYLSAFHTDHKTLLNQIWGFDVGKFPAELSTINLFRQRIDDYENFPRVQNTDIFEVHQGKTFKYPPAQAGQYGAKVNLPVPSFTALIGNFPFIRQELIEKKIKGYKEFLTSTITKSYSASYRKLFNEKYELKLSGQADIYAYIYLHTATLLKPDGGMAVITSNSWLDVAYGAVLKAFFLDHFQVKMVMASWAEPWFEDAAINTVVTVLERTDDPSKRDSNLVRFVKLKKPLTDLIPFRDLRLEGNQRWQRIDDIIGTIESAEHQKNARVVSGVVHSFENDDLRVRMIPQAYLQKELSEKGELDKWGKYLRAPDVYFEILDKCKGKLVPLKSIADVRFGIKTGINEFFYLEIIDQKKKSSFCRNGRGWEGEIENKFLRKVIKSPKEADSIVIDPDKLKFSIFICDKSKPDLRKAGDTLALKYIEWGEKQKTEDGISWPETPSVRSRKHWWMIDEKEPGYILLQMINNDRYVSYLNKDRVQVDHNLFEFLVEDEKYMGTAEKYLNSFVFALIKEVNSRANLGDGATKTEGVDWNNLMLVPFKPLKIDFDMSKFIYRKALSAFEEIRQKDRIALDTAVLQALGLDPKEYLPKIYDGLCGMVRDRLELPKMRKSRKKQSVRDSDDVIKASVIADCLPSGVKKFPKEFYHPGLRNKNLPLDYDKLDFEEFPTTGKLLRYKEFFGKYDIEDVEGQKVHETDSLEKAEFALLLAKTELHVKIPSLNKVVQQILKDYRGYVKSLQDQITRDAESKLHDWARAERMAKEILEEYGVG